MKNPSPYIKLYLTVAIATVIFVALALGIVLPLLQKINLITAQYIDTKQQIVNIEKKRSQITLIEKEYDSIKYSVDKIDATLADQANFLDALIKLENLAESTGNKHSITILEEAKSKKEPMANVATSKYLFFRIVLQGSFENVMSFINNLENADFYNKIEKIEAVKEVKTTAQGIEEDVKATMEVKIYTK